MKKTAKLFVIVSSALLLGIVAVSSWGVNGNVKVLNANQRISIWADGGVPFPPPPTVTVQVSNLLLADGGVPFPPPPPTPTGIGLTTMEPISSLLADGGVPFPPPPTFAGLLFSSTGSIRS